MKSLLLFLICFSILAPLEARLNKITSNIVLQTKKIEIEEFPGAFNPSLIQFEGGFLLSFRYCLHPTYPWVSYIGVVKLDHNFNQISRPQLLNTREFKALTPSQSEDARIFNLNGKIYLIYNDNEEVTNPSGHQRRDMFIAEVFEKNGEFILKQPLKITHEKKYEIKKWQKNWVPFEWNNQLMIGYSIDPHEVLTPNMHSGISSQKSITSIKNYWKWGELRGGTPAILVDDVYLGFFHSSTVIASASSDYKPMHHYYMGAYMFSSTPPFHIKKISPTPILAEGFYTKSAFGKRVIFPGGFAVVGERFYVAYGKDDIEIWIATLDKKNLIKSLKPVKKRH